MKNALIVVDVQNDFCEGGALPVRGGHAVADAIARRLALRPLAYGALVATRDWHIEPGEHFAPDGVDPDYRTTWPAHCVAGTPGAAYDRALGPPERWADVVVSKGQYAAAYSGFEGTTAAGQALDEILRARAIEEVDVVGLATDYCVAATALDAAVAGYRARVLLDLCAGVAEETTADALRQLVEAGVTLLTAGQADADLRVA